MGDIENTGALGKADLASTKLLTYKENEAAIVNLTKAKSAEKIHSSLSNASPPPPESEKLLKTASSSSLVKGNKAGGEIALSKPQDGGFINNNVHKTGSDHLHPSKGDAKIQVSTDEKETEKQVGIKRFLGIFITLLAALQFSLSALVIKVLKYHPFNLGVWRFGVMACIPIPFLLHERFVKKQNVFKEVWPCKSTTLFLLLQAVLGANSLIFVFFGIKYLNIADSIVIGTSAPVFVTLFAFIFLGERCGLFPVVTALLALTGVAIISKPPLFTGAESLSEETLLGVASSFTSMILLTICYVVIRYLRKVHHALLNLCFSLWGLLQSIIMANLTGKLEVPKDLREVGLILVTAALAFFAQTCITLALKFEQAGPVALVRTTEVIFAFTWQAIFLGVEPDFLSVLGAFVTLSGVVLTALRKIVISLPDDNINKKRFRFLML